MRRSVFLCTALFLILFTIFSTAQAAALTVTNGTSNTATGDGCSLVEAIHNANNDAATYPDCAAGSGTDIITLATNVTLTQIVDTALDGFGVGGLPRITSAITINGGTGRTISRDMNGPEFRFFHVTNAGSLTLSYVSLSYGSIPLGQPLEIASKGGAILNNGGLVTVTGGTFSNNKAGYAGGAIYSLNATLALNRMTISGSTGGSWGGAINVEGGSATLTNSRLMANTAGEGGGLYADNATVVIQGSTLSSNSAIKGGAIHYYGSLNTHLEVINSTISGNTATAGQYDTSADIYKGGGGIWARSEEGVGVLVKDSTIAHNTAKFHGGAISSYGNLSVTNSTISRNTATMGHGGGVFQYTFGTATINSSTITRNNGGNRGGGLAGYIWVVNGYQQFLVSNSIVAGNKSRGIDTRLDADCANIPGFAGRPPVTLIYSGSHNVVGMATGCPANGTGDKTIAPANVFTSVIDYNLALNSGTMGHTHALLLGSPAIDAADCATSSPKDQRYVTRGTDGNGDSVPACDIGSYEAPAIPVTITATFTFTPTITPTSTATLTPSHTPTITPTFTVVPPGTPIVVTNGTSSTLTGDGCSLVEAIANANADAYVYYDCAPGTGADTIIITVDVLLKHSVEVDMRFGHAQCPDDYPDEPDPNDLPASYITVMDGGTALPRITSAITIQGGGHTIKRDGTTIPFRLFRVASQGNLTLDSVTLRDGYVYYLDGYYKGNGGALLNDGGIVTINNSIIAFNKTSYNCAVNEPIGYGGGVYNNQGTLTVNNSTFSQNIALNGAGGAIFSFQGQVTLNNSILSQNYAISLNNYGSGGGILSANSTLTINDSVIEYNGADEYEGTGVATYSGFAGGTNPVITTISGSTFTNNNLVLLGTATITNTQVLNNVSTGIKAENLTISGSVVSGNGDHGIVASHSLNVSNSVISQNGLSGIYLDYLATPPTISGSTISGNGELGVFYGIDQNLQSSLTVTNSTISGNAAGGLRIFSGPQSTNTLTLLSSTITNNQGLGLGIVTSDGTVGSTIASSIIAGNSTDCGAQGVNATITSQGHNLVGSGTGCPSNGTGDLTVNPVDVFTTVLDSTLANNGGSTPTHALLSGSPAIDAGDCAVSGVVDQRGELRGTDGNGDSMPGCDIGAYEAAAVGLMPMAMSVPDSDAAGSDVVVPTASSTATETTSNALPAESLTITSTATMSMTPTMTETPTVDPTSIPVLPTNTLEPPTNTPESLPSVPTEALPEATAVVGEAAS